VERAAVVFHGESPWVKPRIAKRGRDLRRWVVHIVDPRVGRK